jgi:hypothetical protein
MELESIMLNEISLERQISNVFFCSFVELDIIIIIMSLCKGDSLGGKLEVERESRR